MRARWLLAQTESQLNACYQLRAYAFGRSTPSRPYQDRFDVQALPDGNPQAHTYEIKRYGITVGTARLMIAGHPHFDALNSETADLLDTGANLSAFINARTLRRRDRLPVVAEIGCVALSDGANRDGAILHQIYQAIASDVQTRGIDILLWTLPTHTADLVNAQGLAFAPVTNVTFKRSAPHVLRHMARYYEVFLPDLPHRLPEIAYDPDLIDDLDDSTLRQITSGCADGARVYWMDAAQFAAVIQGAAVTAGAV